MTSNDAHSGGAVTGGQLSPRARKAALTAHIMVSLVVGALVVGTGEEQMLDGTGGAETRLIGGAAHRVAALVAATALSADTPRRAAWRDPVDRPSATARA
jgi:hypothetical protein